MTPATTTTEQLGTFADCVFEPEDIVEVRELPSGRSTWHAAADLPDEAHRLAGDNDQGENIYCGINPRREPGGRKAADVVVAWAMFCDFDGVDAVEAHRRIQATGLPRPTLTLASGHGVHTYWRLAEPLDDLAEWTATQKRLAVAVGSDHTVHDAPRIARLPGFTNHKPPAARAEIIDADPARRHDLTEIAAALPELVSATPKPAPEARPAVPAAGLDVVARVARYLASVPPAIEGQHGDDHTYRVCCKLVNGFGLTDDQALPLLAEWNRSCVPPWDESELLTKLRNARSYATGEPGELANAPAPHRPTGPPPGANTPAAEVVIDPAAGDTLPDEPAPAWVTVRDVMAADRYREGLPALTTGFATLDTLLDGGVRLGFFYIVAGRTGSAKSQLAANVVRRAALAGICTLFLSLEDGLTAAVWRMHAAAATVQTRDLLNGISGHGSGISALRSTFGLLAGLPVRLADIRPVDHIATTIRHHAHAGGQLVVVDQVSKVTTPNLAASSSTYERASAVSEAMRMAAVENRLALLLVCQVNREASKRGGELELYDLRDSGMLEQDAAGVLLINKATHPAASTGQRPPAAMGLPVKLAKHRFGPAGQTVELLWYPRIARIDDPSTEAGGVR